MNPITRKEVFLAAAGGQDVETPTPVTREEAFLDAIVKGGGSSLPSTETASAGDVLSLDYNKEPLWAAQSGSSGGVLVVTETTETVDEGIKHTLDKTYAEITASDLAVKKYVDSTGDANISTVSCYGEEGGAYYVQFTDEVNFYEATSASGTLSYIGR